MQTHTASRPTAKAPGTTVLPPEAPLLSPAEYFAQMIENCLAFAEAARKKGQPLVGIMCEFTPRELILAANAVPVCLCGGSAQTIPAAEKFLPSNLCPLIKSTFGYKVTGQNPFLERADLVVGETTCDGKKKMFELLAATKSMYVLELPQKADDADALERWVQEVDKFKRYLEQRFQITITRERLRAAVERMNRERSLRRELASLMARENPPFSGRQLLDFKSIISAIPADLEQYEHALARYRKSSSPPNARHKVRVLLTGVPVVHGAERVVELIEECGGRVVCMENCTGLKPILEDVDPNEPDLLRAIAGKYYHLPCSVMTPNRRRADSLRKLAAQFKPECVIELVWHACLTYDIESGSIRELAERDLRLPYLKISTDYSPADSARISSRVQALFELIKS